MKKVVSVKIEINDIKLLRARAQGLGLSMPELLTNIARHGEDVDEFKRLLAESREATMKAISNLSREMIKAIQ